MTRQQFREKFLPRDVGYHGKTHFIPLGSQTDPSFAMTGSQIVANTMRGIPISSPIGLEFNSMKLDQVTEFDVPIKERMNVMDYTRNKLRETDDITRKAYNEMIKDIQEQTKKTQEDEK